MAASHSASEYPAGRTAQAACRSSATISALFACSLASSASGGFAGALSARLLPLRPTQTPLLAASLIRVTALITHPSNHRLRHRPSHWLRLRSPPEGAHDSRR